MGSFEEFFDVQLAWDNGTALALLEALRAHPKALVVVLIGQGHVQEGLGVPQILKAMALGFLRRCVFLFLTPRSSSWGMILVS